MKFFIATICATLFLVGTLFSQVTADLTIENQQVVGTDFFFDIYLTRTGTNNLYLGSADFILTFNSGNFNNPTLSKGASTPGGCTFVPTDQSGFNILFTQDAYSQNTAVSILNGNELTINLNGPTPADQNGFDTRVAVIDNSASTHRLGTFKVSGIQIPSGTMNLQWKTSDVLVFTLANTPPFTSSQATVNAINPPDVPLPVELTSFTASMKENVVNLNWQTKTEINNYGFNVERSVNNGQWNTLGFVEGSGNSNSPKQYSFSDNDLFVGGSKFQYRLKQVDTDGQFEYSDVVEVAVVPTQFELSQNYPNPFNPSTTIRFSLPRQTQLKINIYNMLGELVETLAEGTYEAGYHKVNFSALGGSASGRNASSLSSGAYIYRIESSDFVQVKKMMLLK